MLRRGQLPQTIAAKISPGEPAPPLSAEDLTLISQRLVDFVRFIFFHPRVPDECKPGKDIPLADVEWAIAWGNGEVEGEQRGSAWRISRNNS